MIICIDFDGTIVQQAGRPYADTDSPLVFMPGAREALYALKAARHKLVLWSARSRLALRDPRVGDPLAAIARPRPTSPDDYAVNEARYRQMISFVSRELAGVFDYIYQGGELDKPGADLFIDDKAIRLGVGVGGLQWHEIARMYGEGLDR